VPLRVLIAGANCGCHCGLPVQNNAFPLCFSVWINECNGDLTPTTMGCEPTIVTVRLRLTNICLAVLGSVCWVLLLTDIAAAKSDQRQLADTIAKVRTGEPSTARETAEQLSHLTRRMNPNAVSDQSVADLISLLDIRDDIVRYWVASSLGNLGPRASAAVPSLKRLLAEVACLPGSKTSASGIRFALTQMGVTIPAPACETQSK
jgi:hypothetical protein